ncbi:hypothetical protein TWF481_002713 [Arthrobotrys musiformis]|uniref:Ecp2 effector protein domain-containing protein n=1 Tax=Arthrobotrys musiformis TaxID=47236 RepID=A0AAV9VR00_9PEZI
MRLKPSLLYSLLLGSSALAIAVPAQEGEEGTLYSNPEIRASEINGYLHPNVTYTREHINCAEGVPILAADGTTAIGCFFQNLPEDFNRAIKAIAAKRKIPAFKKAPALEPKQMQKRSGTWYYRSYHCYESGVYSLIYPDLHYTKNTVCKSMNALAGGRMRYASWTIWRIGSASDIINMYSVGNLKQIRHDYAFECLHASDDWVFSQFDGVCTIMIQKIIDEICVGGSRADSRGGTIDVYKDGFINRPYRLRVDPNLIGGGG